MDMEKRSESLRKPLMLFSQGSKKRGMEMAVTTVIMIILSISVLTILVIFFNSQTGFLSKWMRTQQTESNVDAIVGVCEGLVMSESVYAFCCEKKEIVFGGNRSGVKVSCDNVSRSDWAGGRVREMDCASVSCA